MFVAERRQPLHQRLTRELLPQTQRQCGTGEFRRAEPLLRRRTDVRQHDDRLMTQETRHDVHALCRALQPLRRTGCSKVNAVQLGQLIDIRLGQECREILLPCAQRIPSRRHNGERARCCIIGGGDGGVLQRPCGTVQHGLCCRLRKYLRQLTEGGIIPQKRKECIHLDAARAARIKPAKSGCGWFGRDFSSGWNCEATNHG